MAVISIAESDIQLRLAILYIFSAGVNILLSEFKHRKDSSSTSRFRQRCQFARNIPLSVGVIEIVQDLAIVKRSDTAELVVKLRLLNRWRFNPDHIKDKEFRILRTSCYRLMFPGVLIGCIWFVGCSNPKPWPESPLYETPVNDTSWELPASKEDAMAAMAGHYAHYDVVAYEAKTPNGPLSTFVISFGFTDLTIEDGQLVEYDCFCHAEHKANQNMVSSFPDEATQAIQPRSAIVSVYQEEGVWKISRPPTPTLIGIGGNPDLPLSMNPNDPLIDDADNDGKPGVTVFVELFGFIKGEIYLARREVFTSDLALYSDGSLWGSVVDDSEQLVVGASLFILNTPNDPNQRDDPGLNPVILVPIPDDINTCEELMANRDSLFPVGPDF